MASPTRTPWRAAFAVAALLAAACDAPPPVAPAPLPPLAPGVALSIGDVAVAEEEIDRLADLLAELRPASTPPDLRRRVLVNSVLPRIGLSTRNAAARAEALAEAQECARRINDGTWSNVGLPIESPPADLDFFLWVAVRDAAAGQVVGPVESTHGEFFVVVVERPFDPNSGIDQNLFLKGFAFPYLEVEDGVDRLAGYTALDGLEARFASAAWRDLVPISVRSRLVEKR